MSAQTIIVIAVTLAGTVTDLRRGKVYNWLTYPAAAVGLLLSLVLAPPSPWQSLAGMGAALLVFGTLRRVGRMGAGDVKLMAAIGALKGLGFVLFASYYIVVVAGLTAILMLAFNRRLVTTLKWAGSLAAAAVVPGRPMGQLEGGHTDMPLGPAIFIGTMWCLYVEAIRGPLGF